MATPKWRKENADKIKESQRKWYLENKEYLINKNLDRRNRIKEWFVEKKKTLKCERCGMKHIACLQFHHKDPSKKDIEVSMAVINGWSIEHIEKEIQKCEVLCANCHSIHHWEMA